MIEPMDVTVHDDLISVPRVSEIFDTIHQPVYHFGQKSNADDQFGFWIANIPDELIMAKIPSAACGRRWTNRSPVAVSTSNECM